MEKFRILLGVVILGIIIFFAFGFEYSIVNYFSPKSNCSSNYNLTQTRIDSLQSQARSNASFLSEITKLPSKQLVPNSSFVSNETQNVWTFSIPYNGFVLLKISNSTITSVSSMWWYFSQCQNEPYYSTTMNSSTNATNIYAVSAPSNALLAVGPLGTNINSSVSWSMDAGVTYYYLTNSSFDGLPFA
jgi:hypothetical protein